MQTQKNYLNKNPGVLGGDFLVVHNEHVHILGFDITGTHAVMIAVFQRDRHG